MSKRRRAKSGGLGWLALPSTSEREKGGLTEFSDSALLPPLHLSMSLLRPALRAASVPCRRPTAWRAEYMSSLPGGPPPRNSVDDDLPGFFTEPAAPTTPTKPYGTLLTPRDEGPPVAPPGAYAPPRVATNPLRALAPGPGEENALGKTLAPTLLYHLHVQATSNNTITTLTDESASPLATWSGGSCGFKGVNRNGYEAGYQCAVNAFARLEEAAAASDKTIAVEVVLKGFGKGRDAFITALSMTEGERVRPLVTRMTDKTPIKIGGTRAKKMRRL